MNTSDFKSIIFNYYKAHGRHTLPWRNTTDPYKIVVSEIMLQQTQVSRVLQKYPLFLETFPTWKTLAKATTSEVLAAWQGMGYNRRALYLKKVAEAVVGTPLRSSSYEGQADSINQLLQDPKFLETLPGIGKNTAGSIVAFAFNKPVVFIETNIRRVFIHFFFQDKSFGKAQDKETIDDKELLPLIKETLDHKNPREWYYGLMDYGVYLAKTVGNPNRKSKHYTVQSKFEGSNRQVRGAIVKELIKHKTLKMNQLYKLPFESKRIDLAIQSLQKEGFIRETHGVYNIVK